MPIVAMLGFVGNLFSILVLHSPGVDMKVSTLLVIVLVIIILFLNIFMISLDLHLFHHQVILDLLVATQPCLDLAGILVKLPNDLLNLAVVLKNFVKILLEILPHLNQNCQTSMVNYFFVRIT